MAFYFPVMPHRPSSCAPMESTSKSWCGDCYLEQDDNTPFPLPPVFPILLHPSLLPSIPGRLCASWASDTQSTVRAGTRLRHSHTTAPTLGPLWMGATCCSPWFQSTIYPRHPHGCGRIEMLLSRERKTDPSVNKFKKL